MAVVLAVYGAVDLILLLAAKVLNERMKPLFRALGVGKDWKHARRVGKNLPDGRIRYATHQDKCQGSSNNSSRAA
jgi:hypothetical protein